jgi:hypothetical protein
MPAPVNDRHVIEQRAVAVREWRAASRTYSDNSEDVMAVDLRALLHAERIAQVMRDRMMRIRHADLGIGAAAELAADHERRDPGNVALIREPLQVEHQPGVLLEGIGHPGRAIEGRLLEIEGGPPF